MIEAVEIGIAAKDFAEGGFDEGRITRKREGQTTLKAFEEAAHHPAVGRAFYQAAADGDERFEPKEAAPPSARPVAR